MERRRDGAGCRIDPDRCNASVRAAGRQRALHPHASVRRPVYTECAISPNGQREKRRRTLLLVPNRPIGPVHRTHKPASGRRVRRVLIALALGALGTLSSAQSGAISWESTGGPMLPGLKRIIAQRARFLLIDEREQWWR